jgi:hypothetical protein
VGVASAAVGAITGLMSLSAGREAKSECETPGGGFHYPGACDPANRDSATSADKRAHDLALVSTVTFIGGGALLAFGAALFFTAPSGSSIGSGKTRLRVAPVVGSGSSALVLGGAW